MMDKFSVKQFLGLTFAAAFLLLSGSASNVFAQRDPFEKSPLNKPRVVNPNPNAALSGQPGAVGQPKAVKPKPAGPPPIIALGAPPIDQRINYYKRLREDAATSGLEIPKVTSVLTLEEMSVIGIFHTPRGYAAMVEAKPIKLSYTIYPGEKFFDGQLVAVEENRLVFRKVVKMSNGKFTASVENKALRQYSMQEEVQGTAPLQPSQQPAPSETAVNNAAIVPTVTVVASPLEEMLKQPAEQPKAATAKDKNTKSKNAKNGKKTVKVAENKQP
ncbi:MAG: hypothetical protein H0U87_10505 [Acidobacteria bacterium]|nr:hypothetical protein [Acidobacteriota bacterium]